MAALDPVLSWIFCIALCIISLISLLANTVLLRWKPSSPDDRFNYQRLKFLLASQALSGLTTAMVLIPLWLFILITQFKDGAGVDLDEINQICFYSFDMFHGFLALIHLLVIAIERVYATVWPIIHRIASDRVNYMACIASWFVASSMSSIVIVVYYFTKAPVLVVFTASGCFGLPILLICVSFLVIPARLSWRILTPFQKKDIKIAKAMALVFLSFMVVSLPYQTVNLLGYFCSSCGVFKLSLLLGLRFLYYSSSAVIPMVVILTVPELRSKAAWCCFRFHAINEQSRNELYAMEIPGVEKARKTSCTLINTRPNTEQTPPYQVDIPL